MNFNNKLEESANKACEALIRSLYELNINECPSSSCLENKFKQLKAELYNEADSTTQYADTNLPNGKSTS